MYTPLARCAVRDRWLRAFAFAYIDLSHLASGVHQRVHLRSSQHTRARRSPVNTATWSHVSLPISTDLEQFGQTSVVSDAEVHALQPHHATSFSQMCRQTQQASSSSCAGRTWPRQQQQHASLREGPPPGGGARPADRRRHARHPEWLAQHQRQRRCGAR